MQSTHEPFPLADLNLPSAHSAHACPFSPEKPGSQVQSVALLLPTADDALRGHGEHDALAAAAYVCAGHSPQVSAAVALATAEALPAAHASHAAGPFSSLYCPGRHAEHVSPLAPVKPALHSQAAASSLRAGDCAWAGQRWQLACPVPEKVLGAHPWQSSSSFEPAFGANVPAPHTEHCSCPESWLKKPGEHG